MATANRNAKAFDHLSELKRHLRSCKRCIAAKKADSAYEMCERGIWLVVRAATQFDDLIRLRTAAHNHPGGVIYPCPDLSKHGSAYSLTATPHLATGIQDRLF